MTHAKCNQMPTALDHVGHQTSERLEAFRTSTTAEPIEMPFGLRTRVGPGNHVLVGVQIPSWEGAILGEGAPIVTHRDLLL